MGRNPLQLVNKSGRNKNAVLRFPLYIKPFSKNKLFIITYTYINIYDVLTSSINFICSQIRCPKRTGLQHIRRYHTSDFVLRGLSKSPFYLMGLKPPVVGIKLLFCTNLFSYHRDTRGYNYPTRTKRESIHADNQYLIQNFL